MFLLQWDAVDLALIALGIFITAVVVFKLAPGAPIYRDREFTRKQITSYDRDVPRYFLFAALALILGGAHTLIKSFPGIYNWLWEAGYGGHLVRDLSNSHIVIVGGGTVLLTGITWYVLPRWTNRPLYSNTLASISLWFTLIGVYGFYASWLVLGIVEGEMVRHGSDYAAAKEFVGAWHRIPTGATSSIMGIGYWTYVLNVFLTIWVARFVPNKPNGYLVKFAAVSAAALFVGTVQGVLQVSPDNAVWLLAAGKFGQYIDPISHAHINLVTGMMVSIGAFLMYFAPRLGGQPIAQRSANKFFWILVPGSLVFYFAFLITGLVMGNVTNGYGGLNVPALVPFVASTSRFWLALGGSLMLLGFWYYFYLLFKSLSVKPDRSAPFLAQETRSGFTQALHDASPKAFWFVSAIALFVGTFQGMLQIIPATAQLLTLPEEVPNIHAQLNMIGGVVLALMGVVYVLMPELTGARVPERLRKWNLYGIASGIGGYYLVVLLSGLVRASYLRQGMNDAAAAAQLGFVAPLFMVITALPMLLGYIAFGAAMWEMTRAYRVEWLEKWRDSLSTYSGPLPERVRKIPMPFLLALEFIAGVFGFPGLGWLYAGQALVGVALLVCGPAIAWALVPLLVSPFADTVFQPYGIMVLLVWLGGTSVASTALLAGYIRLKQMLAQAPEKKPREAVTAPLVNATPSVSPVRPSE